MLKAAFDIAADGACRLSSDQEPFCFTDRYHGGINISAVRQPSDLVSFKPRADVIVDAVAHAPGGAPSPTWGAGVTVRSGEAILAEKRLRVTGPRQWDPQWRVALTERQLKEWGRHFSLFSGWRLTEPTPVVAVPIRYELAFGGAQVEGLDDDGREIVCADERNPIGRGWISREFTDHTRAAPAPQIEAWGEPVTDPFQRYEPQGLGPIPPAWTPRRPLGGTFDQNWIDTVWPRWPADYDFAFNNSAATGLTLPSFPQGLLVFELLNLRPGVSEFHIRLPDIRPLVLIDDDVRVRAFRPHLDTVTLLLAADDLFDCRVTAVWRISFDLSTTKAIAIDVPDEDERRRIEAEAESLATAPHPSSCARPSDLLETVE